MQLQDMDSYQIEPFIYIQKYKFYINMENVHAEMPN